MSIENLTKEELWRKVISDSKCGPCFEKCLLYVSAAKRYINGDINQARDLLSMECKEDRIIKTIESKDW